MPPGIQTLIIDMERWLGISLTIKDQSGLLVNDQGHALLPDFPAHRNWYCLYKRPETMSWRRQCMKHCNHDIPRRVERAPAPFCCECWKGLREVIVPILDENGVGFLFYAGVFRCETPAPFLSAPECPEAYRKRYALLPILTVEDQQRIVQTLTVFGYGILHEVRMQRDELPGKAGQIHRYIRENYGEKISLEKLSEVLHLSASRTSHLVRELTGQSFSDLLMAERIRRARNLLVSSGMPMGEIARKTGFCNEYYLSRQFSRLMGMSPGVFRQKSQRKNTEDV